MTEIDENATMITRKLAANEGKITGRERVTCFERAVVHEFTMAIDEESAARVKFQRNPASHSTLLEVRLADAVAVRVPTSPIALSSAEMPLYVRLRGVVSLSRRLAHERSLNSIPDQILSANVMHRRLLARNRLNEGATYHRLNRRGRRRHGLNGAVAHPGDRPVQGLRARGLQRQSLKFPPGLLKPRRAHHDANVYRVVALQRLQGRRKEAAVAAQRSLPGTPEGHWQLAY